jgi:hypothetical protein
MEMLMTDVAEIKEMIKAILPIAKSVSTSARSTVVVASISTTICEGTQKNGERCPNRNKPSSRFCGKHKCKVCNAGKIEGNKNCEEHKGVV